MNRRVVIKYFSLIILFLYGANFLGKEQIWGLALIIPVASMTGTRIRKSTQLGLLFLTFISYVIFGRYLSFVAILRLLVCPCLFFYFAYLYVDYYEYQIEECTNIYYSLAWGFALQEFLTLITNLSTAGNRYIPDFWTGQLIQPTNFNSRGIFVVVLLYYVLKYEKRTIHRYIYFVSLISVLVASIMTASRTNLYFSVIFFVVDYFVDTFILRKMTAKEFTKEKLTRKAIGRFMGGAIIVSIVVLRYFSAIEAWFVKSALVERQESNVARFSISNDPRWSRWSESIAHLIDNPMGDKNALYAHNMILDVWRVAGIIAMFFMLILVIYQIRVLIKLCRKKTLVQSNKKAFAFCTYFGVFMSFMIEPVLEGRPFIYIGSCILYGIINRWLLEPRA